jgi:hypothetical protein
MDESEEKAVKIEPTVDDLYCAYCGGLLGFVFRCSKCGRDVHLGCCYPNSAEGYVCFDCPPPELDEESIVKSDDR